MREIKFRGYDTNDGARTWVTFTLDELLSGSDDYELIDPDTVVQLIETDKNGCEVYEGDTVIRIAPNPDWDEDDFDAAKAFPMAATFDDYRAIRDGEIVKVTS